MSAQPVRVTLRLAIAAVDRHSGAVRAVLARRTHAPRRTELTSRVPLAFQRGCDIFKHPLPSFPMRLFFERETPKQSMRIPRPSVLPDRSDLSVSACYKGARIGGDYYDFLPISGTRIVFLLSDVAGKRTEALDIAAALQDALHERAPELLGDPEANVSDGVTALALELNRTVIQAAGGVRPAPTF